MSHPRPLHLRLRPDLFAGGISPDVVAGQTGESGGWPHPRAYFAAPGGTEVAAVGAHRVGSPLAPFVVVLPFDSSAPLPSPWDVFAAVTRPSVTVSRDGDAVWLTVCGGEGEDARGLRARAAEVRSLLALADRTAAAADGAAGRGATSARRRAAADARPPADAPRTIADPREAASAPAAPGTPAVLAPSARTELRGRIASAIQAIEAGEVGKVVVSTSLAVDLEEAADPAGLLQAMRAVQPDAYLFLLSADDDHHLVGASPELLVEVDGARVRTMALAGSARRDPDPARDDALGEALLSSAKDLSEHRWVVDAVAGALEPLAADLVVPPAPRLRRLATIQHLETPIEATLRVPADILELAARLHPTPALAGWPREAAMAVIRRLEGAGSRGLYGGAVGIGRPGGGGVLAVAIRCVQLDGRRATAFAGAGIVAGSDPDAEVAEIELKLAASLAALGAGQGGPAGPRGLQWQPE